MVILPSSVIRPLSEEDEWGRDWTSLMCPSGAERGKLHGV